MFKYIFPLNILIYFLLIYLSLFHVFEGYACMSVGAPMPCHTHGGQETVPDLLKLRLQMVVTCPMGAGILTWVFCKKRQCFLLLNYHSSPSFQYSGRPYFTVEEIWPSKEVALLGFELRCSGLGPLHSMTVCWLSISKCCSSWILHSCVDSCALPGPLMVRSYVWYAGHSKMSLHIL